MPPIRQAPPGTAPGRRREKGNFLTRAPGEALRLVQGVPSAVVGLGKGGIEEFRRTNVVTGKASLPRLIGSGAKIAGSGFRGTVAQAEFRKRFGDEAAKQLQAGDVEGALATALPITGGFAGSFLRSGARLGSLPVSLAPGGLKPSESRFARDYGQHPVSSLVEDLANASVVLGPLGAGAGKVAEGAQAGSRLARGAATVQRSLTAAEKGANLVGGAPIYPYQKALGVVGKAAAPVLEAAAQTKAGSNVAERLADRRLRGETREFLRGQGANISRTVERTLDTVHGIAKELPNRDEQAALILLHQGEHVPLRALEGLAEDVRNQAVNEVFSKLDERLSVTPEAARIATDYAEGRLAPEVTARLDAGLDRLRKEVSAPRTAAELAGTGRLGGPMNPEQVGNAPLTSVIDKAIEKPLVGVRQAEKLATSLRQKATKAADALADAKADLGEVFEQRAKAGRGRTPLYGEGKRLGRLEARVQQAESLANRAETVLVRRRARVQETAAKAASSIEAAPKRFRPALHRGRELAAALRKQADALEGPARDAVLQAAGEAETTLQRLVDEGVDPAHLIGGVLPEGKKGAGRLSTGEHLPTQRHLSSERLAVGDIGPRTLRGVAYKEAEHARQAALNIAADEFTKRYAKRPAEVGLDADTFRGRDLAKLAHDAGYEGWNPRTLFEKVPDDQFGPDTMLVRKHQFEDFSSWFGKEGRSAPDKVARAIRHINTAINTPILLLSPRWQVGNAVSQAMMIPVAGGLGPLEIARFGNEAARLLRHDPDAIPARLTQSGFFAHGEGMEWLQNEIREPGRFRRLLDRSAGVNDWVDRWAKTTVYLAKKAKGFSDEEAVKRALQVQPDFARLSPFERNVVRAVTPYWAWQKHITKLALRLPLEHPVRTAWVLHLADEYGDDQSQLPEFLRGGIRLSKNKFLPVGNIVNPFGDIGGSPVLSPSGFARSLSPALRLAAAAGFGANAGAGGRYLTRPEGTGNLDDLGRPTITPLANRPRELGYVVSQSFPQTRLVAGVAGKPILRYENGDPVLVKGKTVPLGRGRLNSLGRFLGIPVPENVPAQEILDRANKRREAAAKKVVKYQTARRSNQPTISGSRNPSGPIRQG